MRSALSWLVAAGVLVRLGASPECCSEGASFWDDLEDPARTPAGAGSHAESKLPRLCPAHAMLGAAGSSFARCAGGALSSLHLLEHVSAARSWQRLLDIKPAMRTSQHFLNHLPAWSALQLIPAARIRIFYCSPPGWQGYAVSKSKPPQIFDQPALSICAGRGLSRMSAARGATPLNAVSTPGVACSL